MTDAPNKGVHPLITVIIRSKARATLPDALASVARQTHPNLEVVIIDATGGRHPGVADRCGPFPVRLIPADAPLNRPQAANRGLDHASGEWLIFLDDDDFFDPPHVASLLATAQRSGRRVAYSGTRVLDAQGRVVWQLNHPYARLALFEHNYIQMGAALFYRSLVELGCRFDENMLLYQDWDFWLQLAKHGDFAHSNVVTNNWRAYSGQSGAGTGPNADVALQTRFTRRLREKWGGARDRLVVFLGKAGRHAQWLLSHRRAQDAVRLLSVAITLAPEDPGLLNLLGIAFFQAGQLGEAWKVLMKAQQLLPDNESVRRNLELVERKRFGTSAEID